jgi:hypothetical protein
LQKTRDNFHKACGNKREETGGFRASFDDNDFEPVFKESVVLGLGVAD